MRRRCVGAASPVPAGVSSSQGCVHAAWTQQRFDGPAIMLGVGRREFGAGERAHERHDSRDEKRDRHVQAHFARHLPDEHVETGADDGAEVEFPSVAQLTGCLRSG